MTACGPGSSKRIRHHADEVRSSQTAPSSAAGWVATTPCKTVVRQAIEPSQLPGVLPLAIDADGRTLGGIGAPFLRQWVQPHRPDAERRRRSLPAAIVISCTLAGRRSEWRERAHRASCTGLWRVQFKVISKRTRFESCIGIQICGLNRPWLQPKISAEIRRTYIRTCTPKGINRNASSVAL